MEQTRRIWKTCVASIKEISKESEKILKETTDAYFENEWFYRKTEITIEEDTKEIIIRFR